MTDYIKREDAINAIDVGNLHHGIVDALQSFIREIPVADVRENVHAQWILVDDGTDYWAFWECSNCHNECYAEGKMRMKYCPDCGARMDGGDEQ